MNRAQLLAQQATRWKKLDIAGYPFTRRVATQLAGHDDRTAYPAGIDVIVRGLER